MSNTMSLEQQIADLTTATTNLLDAVNVRKIALDAAEDAAAASAAAASQSAAAAQAAASGTVGSLAPEAGKVPLAGEDGKIASEWVRDVVTMRTGPGGEVEFSEEVTNAIAALGGISDLQFQATATHLQWKTADTSWADLVSLADIGGTDFSLIEWRVSATHLQWMYDGVTWVDVVPLSSLGVSGGGGQTTVVEGAGILVSASGSAYTVSNDDRGSAAVAGHEAATNPHSQYALTAHTHTGYAPTSHTHTIANVSGLQSALDTHTHTEYALTAHTHTGYAPTSHTHTIANVSGLQSALDTHTHTEYAPTSHTHTIANVSGLQSALDTHTHSQYAAVTHTHTEYALTAHTHTGYASTSHTHTIANVSGLQSALDAKQGSIVVSNIAPSNPVEGQLWVQVA